MEDGSDQMGGEQHAVTEDLMVVFFYKLLRDLVHPGEMEGACLEVEGRHGEEFDLTNRFLAEYAKNLVGRLRLEFKVQVEPQPPYPAELLDELAGALAWWATNKQPQASSTRVVQALDRYSAEVGRENVPAEVAAAIGELGP